MAGSPGGCAWNRPARPCPDGACRLVLVSLSFAQARRQGGRGPCRAWARAARPGSRAGCDPTRAMRSGVRSSRSWSSASPDSPVPMRRRPARKRRQSPRKMPGCEGHLAWTPGTRRAGGGPHASGHISLAYCRWREGEARLANGDRPGATTALSRGSRDRDRARAPDHSNPRSSRWRRGPGSPWQLRSWALLICRLRPRCVAGPRAWAAIRRRSFRPDP